MLARKSQKRGLHFSVAIVSAREAAAPGAPGSRRDLERVIEQAAAAGMIEHELEARLALGEIELRFGDGAGLACAEALEHDAPAKGFGLIARKAAAERT